MVMKRRELERRLRAMGWRFLRSGSKHDVWWNGKKDEPHEYIPRHNEVGERLAQKILKIAREYPGD